MREEGACRFDRRGLQLSLYRYAIFISRIRRLANGKVDIDPVVDEERDMVLSISFTHEREPLPKLTLSAMAFVRRAISMNWGQAGGLLIDSLLQCLLPSLVPVPQ